VIELPGFERPHSEVQTLTTGDVLGLSWILEPYEYLFSARTADDVLALGFDAEATRALMKKDFEFGFELLMRFTRSTAARLEAARVQMVAMGMDINTTGQS
jgi:CRP/FNR family cyclic AMP-dependent transcriptional regulator